MPLYPQHEPRKKRHAEVGDDAGADQLLRRITCIRFHYHYRDEYYYKDFSPYCTLSDMEKATIYNPYAGDKSDFVPIQEDLDLFS